MPFFNAVGRQAGPAGGDSHIDIQCGGEDIECPPTSIPRQQALYLAMTMGVTLIKIYGDGSGHGSGSGGRADLSRRPAAVMRYNRLARTA